MNICIEFVEIPMRNRDVATIEKTEWPDGEMAWVDSRIPNLPSFNGVDKNKNVRTNKNTKYI